MKTCTSALARAACALAVLACTACKRDATPVASDAAAAPAPTAEAAAPPASVADTPPPTATSAPSASASFSVADAAPPPASVDPVRVLDVGRNRRQRLRYELALGHVETMQLQLDVSATAQPDGSGPLPTANIPPVRVAMTFDPKSKLADGSVRFEVKLSTIGFATAESAPPDKLAELKKALDSLKGFGGFVVVTPRGITTQAALDAPAGIGPAAAQWAEQLRQLAREPGAPLPDEEVGVGARWERMSKLEQKTLKAQETDTYTLLDATRTTAALSLVSKQTAPRQPATVFPPDSHLEIDKLALEGTGAVSVDLRRLIPTSSTMTATTTFTLIEARVPGEEKRTTMTMKAAWTIAGSAP